MQCFCYDREYVSRPNIEDGGAVLAKGCVQPWAAVHVHVCRIQWTSCPVTGPTVGRRQAVRVLVEEGWVNEGGVESVPEGLYTVNVVSREVL